MYIYLLKLKVSLEKNQTAICILGPGHVENSSNKRRCKHQCSVTTKACLPKYSALFRQTLYNRLATDNSPKNPFVTVLTS